MHPSLIVVHWVFCLQVIYLRAVEILGNILGKKTKFLILNIS